MIEGTSTNTVELVRLDFHDIITFVEASFIWLIESIADEYDDVLRRLAE